MSIEKLSGASDSLPTIRKELLAQSNNQVGEGMLAQLSAVTQALKVLETETPALAAKLRVMAEFPSLVGKQRAEVLQAAEILEAGKVNVPEFHRVQLLIAGIGAQLVVSKGP